MPLAQRARTFLFIAAGALVIVGGFAWFHHGKKGDGSTADAAEKGGGKDGKGGANPDARPTAVLVAKIESKDVPIWLEGLGTVSAWYQVTVRSQIDGRLDKVFFQDGQSVKKGDMLAQIDPRPFDVQRQTAEGQLVRDKAMLLDATINLDRNEQLRKQSLVAQQAVDDQRSLVGQSEGNVKVDQAAINTAVLNLDYARVRAPFDGVVGVRLVDPGNIIHATDTTGIVILTQLDPIAVFMTLPQDDLARIVKAQKRGDVPIEVYGRDAADRLAVGKLLAIDNQVNTATSTIRLKASFPNASHALWPNQFVKARVLVDTEKDALVVPAAAVQHGPNGTFVYYVKSDGTADVENVTVDTITGEVAVIKTKLPVGTQVVIEGQSQLRPKAKVNIVQPSKAQTAQTTQTKDDAK